MRKLAVFAFATALLLAPTAPEAQAAGPKSPPKGPAEKVGVCHYSEEDGSYTFIRVSANAQGHLKHAEDVHGVSGPGDCPAPVAP